jgi:LmbE family N-acetylglucosaminyl deacetylase
MTEKLTMVAIYAHPDDEAFGTGGTLTKYSHEGVDVHLITATLGEAGQVANPELEFVQPISVIREQELRCACKHYGIKELHLLGYVDGQTTVAPQREAVFKVVKLLRQIKPQVVITFGPDGVYGHYDHLAVHRWAAAAVKLAAENECWEDAGPVHQVSKFYYRALPQQQVDQMIDTMGRDYVSMDGGVPFPFVGYPMDQITTVVDVSKYWMAKLRGIRCHASQLAPDAYKDDEDNSPDEWLTQETFILAQCQPDIETDISNGQKEDDLFAGLR